MKKWMYLIFPGVMLGIFLIFYLSSKHKMDEQKRIVAEQKAHADEEAAARKKQAEEAARIAARKRAEEQKAEDLKKESDRLAKYQAALRTIQEQEAKNKAEADLHSKNISDLEVQLDNLRRDRDRLTKEDFDLVKRVEAVRVQQRDAELDIQRMVGRISQRATNSQMVQAPPLPPPER